MKFNQEKPDLNDPQYKKSDTAIRKAIEDKKFSLSTIFDLIAGMDGPRAYFRIEEVINDENNSFADLRAVFETKGKLWKEHYKELRRRTILAIIRRKDCQKTFIKQYAKEAFPDLKN